MRSAVVPLMRQERFACLNRRVVHKLIALAHWHTLRRSHRRAGRRTGSEPRFAAVVRALNNLSKPAAALRRVKTVGIRGGTLQVRSLPAADVRPTHVTPIAFTA